MDVGRGGAGPASGVAFASDLDGTLCPQGSWSRFDANGCQLGDASTLKEAPEAMLGPVD